MISGLGLGDPATEGGGAAYVVEELDPADSRAVGDITRVINAAFGSAVAWDHVLATTESHSLVAPTLYLGARCEGELVGLALFISHDLLYNGAIVNGFQVSTACTVPAHRNRRVFFRICERAKELLRARGAGLLFSFGRITRPAFLGPLGFRDGGGYVKLNIKAVPGLFHRSFRPFREDETLLLEDTYCQNDRQLVRLRQQVSRREIAVFADDGNVVWGKVERRTVAGLPMRLFSVGGLVVNYPHRLRCSIAGLVRAHHVQVVQLVAHQSAPILTLFRGWRAAPAVDRLVMFDLNRRTGPDDRLNFMIGLKDDY